MDAGVKERRAFERRLAGANRPTLLGRVKAFLAASREQPNPPPGKCRACCKYDVGRFEDGLCDRCSNSAW